MASLRRVVFRVRSARSGQAGGPRDD